MVLGSISDNIKTRKPEKLNVLILEDRMSDAELVKIQFDELEFETEYKVTDTKEEYLHFLQSFKPDLVISDFNLPRFDGLKALNLLRNTLRDQITPFIYVTGTLGEENAVKAIKGGATDFIVKDKIHQLPAAILRALREKGEKLSRKKAADREVLRERRFKRLVQAGSDLIAITDYQGKVKFLSDNYEKVLGYDHSEFLKKDPFEWIHPEDVKKVKATFNAIKNKHSLSITPYRFMDANKHWRWFQSIVTNMYSDEAIAGIVVNSTEVTRLIEKERDLLLSNEKYYLASLATQDLIYDWDLKEGTINRDAQALYRLYGYNPKKAHDEQFWKEKIHPEDRDRVYEHLRICLQDRKQTLCQQSYRFRRNDGSYAYVSEKGYILRDADGVAIRLIGATRDISEQKEKEILKDLILKLTTQLSKPGSLADCTNKVLKTLVKHLGVTYSELWLPARHNNHLNLISQYAEDASGQIMFEGKGQMLKNEGLPGKVFNEGKVVIWKDIRNKTKFTRKESVGKANLESAIGIPISYTNQIMGVFVFFSRNKEHNFKRNVNLLRDVSEWIAPELKRKEASEELNRFFATSADLLCILGTDGFFKKINPAFTEILGYSELELLRSPLKHFVHPADHQLTRSQLDLLEHGSRSVHFENRNIAKDGSVKWFSWSAIIQPKEEVVFAVGKEITEKKKLEELVNETQTMAKIGGWELDMIKQTLHWTAQTKEIHEVDQDYEPTLDTAINFYKEESRAIVEKGVNEGIESGIPWDVEVQIITAKGNEKWVRALGRAEMSEGKCIRLYGSFQDIDDSKKREEALRASNQRFSLASKASREAIYEWDCLTNALIWTDGYRTLFGYDELEVTLDDWREKIHDLDRDRIFASLNTLLADPDQLFWKSEYRYLRKDGKIAFVEDRGYVIRDAQGKPKSMIGSVDDLTEKKMFQEQLLENTIQSQEQERNRIAQELHDGIVQEMVVCSMQSDLLRRSANGEKELEDKINELTDYIKQITNSTRDISHNLLSANVKEMTLGELVERLDLSLRLTSEISFNIENYLDPDLMLDDAVKINLYRVIQELSNNIIKHSWASKALITLERIENKIEVLVSDNGKGIHGDAKSGGIGLSNVSDRINLIGGRISFQNGKKGGLEVKIEIPVGIASNG